MSDILTQGSSSTSYLQIFALRGNERTENGAFASGLDLAPRTALGRITASNLLTALNPGASDGSEKFVGITIDKVNTTTSGTNHTYWWSGDFNVDAIVWPSALATLDARRRAVQGSAITVRKLA